MELEEYRTNSGRMALDGMSVVSGYCFSWLQEMNGKVMQTRKIAIHFMVFSLGIVDILRLEIYG